MRTLRCTTRPRILTRSATASRPTGRLGPRAIARAPDDQGRWSPEIRTPLGLVPEDDGTFTVFYTGFEQKPDWTALMESKPANTFAIGSARVKVVD